MTTPQAVISRSIDLSPCPAESADNDACLCCDLPVADCDGDGQPPTYILRGDDAINAHVDKQLYPGLHPDDLEKHTHECLDRSWVVYGRSPLFEHTCTCVTWTREELERERLIVGREELGHRRDRIARERERWHGADAKLQPDATLAGATLDDLAAVFDEEVDLTPVPAIMGYKRADGTEAMVLPAGKINWIYGGWFTGKSYIGEIAIYEAVLRGGRAIFLDYGDSKKTFHQRAAMLGFNLKAHADSFRYVAGGLADYPLAMAQTLAWLQGNDVNPAMNLVVVDACEASGCPSDGGNVNPWLEKVVFPWNKIGASVTVLDHTPKTKIDKPDGAIGSQRKIGAITGIGLLLSGLPWTKHKGGHVTLTCDKDRTGDYGRKQPVASIIGEYHGEGDARGFSYRIAAPNKDGGADDAIGNIILRVVDAAGPAGFAGKRALLEAVGGNRNAASTTVDNLVEGNLLAITKRGKTGTYTLTTEGAELLD